MVVLNAQDHPCQRAPLPPANADTPSVMLAQDSSRSACMPNDIGMLSPSASRPTSTPAHL